MSDTDFSLIIPELSADIELICREDGQHLVFNNKMGYRLKVSPEVFILLNIIDNKSNIIELTEKFQIQSNESISPEEIHKCLYGKLAECGIIITDREVHKAKPTYLRLRMTLIKNNVSGHITRYCKWLCNPALFYPLFVITFIYLISFSIFRWDDIASELRQMDMMNTIIVFVLLSAGIFCHEFGHITACDYFGAKHGDIGFGFYIFTPVMYADVSDIWRLSSKHRIICNLSGMYFGNLFCIIISFAYLLSGNPIFLYISLFEFIQSLYNLNPLVKYDGYWVLSDLLDVPNLHSTSYAIVKNVPKNYKTYSVKEWMLALYGIISMSFIFVFIFILLVITPDSIFKFPVNLYNYVSNIISGDTSFNLQGLTRFIPPALFYWLTIKWIIQYAKKISNFGAKRQSVNKA